MQQNQGTGEARGEQEGDQQGDHQGERQGDQRREQGVSLLAQLAREYFVEGRSKVEIAKRHELSRFQVARLLDQARDEGVVRITIVDPSTTGAEHEGLKNQLGISTVTVVPDLSGEPSRSALARHVAGLLPHRVHEGARLGVAWSRTLMHLPEHLDSLPRVDVVQLVGPLSAPGTSTASSSALIHTLGSFAGGEVFPLPIPLILDSAEVASALRPMAEVRAALEAADDLDCAVVSIGAWQPGKSTLWSRLGPGEQQAAEDAGVVAEVSGILLTADGSVARSGVEDRVIGVNPEQLKRARVIAAAPATGHPEAVIAAVRAGFVDDLVLSVDLAEQLAEMLG